MAKQEGLWSPPHLELSSLEPPYRNMAPGSMEFLILGYQSDATKTLQAHYIQREKTTGTHLYCLLGELFTLYRLADCHEQRQYGNRIQVVDYFATPTPTSTPTPTATQTATVSSAE